MTGKRLQPKWLRTRDFEIHVETLRRAPKEFHEAIKAILQDRADLRGRLFDAQSELRRRELADKERMAEVIQVRETARVAEEKLTAEYVSPEERERIRNEVRQKTMPPPDPRLPKETTE